MSRGLSGQGDAPEGSLWVKLEEPEELIARPKLTKPNLDTSHLRPLVDGLSSSQLVRLKKQVSHFSKLPHESFQEEQFFEKSRDQFIREVREILGDREDLLPVLLDVEQLQALQWSTELTQHPAELLQVTPRDMMRLISTTKQGKEKRRPRDSDATFLQAFLPEMQPQEELKPILVTNISANTTTTTLVKSFRPCGKVARVEFIEDVRFPAESQAFPSEEGVEAAWDPTPEIEPTASSNEALQGHLQLLKEIVVQPDSVISTVVQEQDDLLLKAASSGGEYEFDSLEEFEGLEELEPEAASISAAPGPKKSQGRSATPPAYKAAFVWFQDIAALEKALSPPLYLLGIAINEPPNTAVCRVSRPGDMRTLVVGWTDEFLHAQQARVAIEDLLQNSLGEVRVVSNMRGSDRCVFCYLSCGSFENANTVKRILQQQVEQDVGYKNLRIGWARPNFRIPKASRRNKKFR